MQAVLGCWPWLSQNSGGQGLFYGIIKLRRGERMPPVKNHSRRSLKVNATSGYHYQDTPTITLKGQYLSEYGFAINTHVSVQLSQNKIVITKTAD